MKILVTSGATREPIDAVRFISNVSTGATGAALADGLDRRGHRVTLLHGPGAVQPRHVRAREEFSSAADLETRLQRHLASGKFDAVVMCAAVADYRPRGVRRCKLPSTAAGLTLRLVRNRKILTRLKRFSPRPLVVVGFKLTAGASPAARARAVAAQFAAGGVDAVVHNDLAEIRGSLNPFRVFRANTRTHRGVSGCAKLAEFLAAYLQRSSLPSRAGLFSTVARRVSGGRSRPRASKFAR
jgi:phosphopantothenoylcysteine decarboxylase/phosphopantothenate--cysteine ligase